METVQYETTVVDVVERRGGDGFTSLIKLCGRVRHRSLVSSRSKGIIRDFGLQRRGKISFFVPKNLPEKYPPSLLFRTNAGKEDRSSFKEKGRGRSHAFPSSRVSRILCELATSLCSRVNNPVIEYDRGWRVAGEERSVCDTFLIACKLPPSHPLRKATPLNPFHSLPFPFLAEGRERERELRRCEGGDAGREI